MTATTAAPLTPAEEQNAIPESGLTLSGREDQTIARLIEVEIPR
jgi:hypothetical protein